MSITYRISSTSPDTIRPMFDLVQHDLTAFWAQQGDARLYVHAHLATFDERLAALATLGGQDWRTPYLNEQGDYYRALEKTLYTVDVYLTLWPDAKTDLAVFEATLAERLHVPAIQRVPFPHVASGDYRAGLRTLTPMQAGAPYVGILAAHDVRGTWALQRVEKSDGIYDGWQALFDLNLPLTLAIDIQTLDRGKVANKLRWAQGRALQQTAGQRASTAVLDEVQSAEAVHLVRYAIMLHARRPELLDSMEQHIKQVLGRRLQLHRFWGMQERHVKFFMDVPPRDIPALVPARNTPSSGLANKMPLSVRRSVEQHGVLLGTDTQEGMPFHYHWFGADGRANGNAVVVGTSGSGKTTALLTLAARLAIMGYKVFLMEPAHTCWRLRDAIHDPAAVAFYQMSDTQAINILDPCAALLIDQRDAVVRKLQTILGKPKHEYGRTRILPYELEDAELGALDLALRHERIYGAGGQRLHDMHSDTAPRLHDMVAVLREQERDGANKLAERIESRLLGAMASLYDRPTALHFDTSTAVTLFSFRGVKQERLPLIYAHVFDEINHYVWSPERDNERQEVVLIVDEFFYMKSVPLMEEEIVRATKTGRGRQFGVVTADQDVPTYWGEASGDNGAMLVGNARQKFIFQTNEQAPTLERHYQGVLDPRQVQTMRTLRRGHCVAMLDNEIRTLRIDLLPHEARSLLR